MSQRVSLFVAAKARHGLRHSANTTPADTIRSQATPLTGTRANSSTANDGPR